MVTVLSLPANRRQLILQTGLVITVALALAWLPLPVGTLLALGLVAAVLALIFPWTVWLVLAAMLPVAAGLHYGPASPADALIAIGLALWAVDGVRRGSLRIRAEIPIAAVFIYLAVLLAAAIGALDLGEALTEVVKWVEFAGVILLTPLVLPIRRAEWLVIALLVAAMTQAAIGLYQFFFRIGPDWFLIQGRFMRASGVFRQPNPFAGYLGLTLPVAISLSLYAADRFGMEHRQLSAWTRLVFYPAATGVIGLGLVASWSRGGWLGAVAGVVVVVALYSRRTAGWLAVGVLVVALLALGGTLNSAWLPTAITSRVADLPAYFGLGDVLNQPVTDDNFAVIERLAHWVAALRMWELHPWLGIGPGNYAASYAAVALPRWDQPLGHAHNIYLNVLAETGLVGLLAFAAMWLSLGGWVLRQAWRTRDAFAHALAVGVAGVLTHLAVHSVFDNLFVQGMVIHLALWLVAVAVAAHPLAEVTGHPLHESEN